MADPTRDLATLRARVRRLDQAVANLSQRAGLGSPAGLFQVVDQGQIPTAAPRFFAAVPASVAAGTQECEGCQGAVAAGPATDARPILILGPAIPKAGDLVRARQIDGYWVADCSGGKSTSLTITLTGACGPLPGNLPVRVQVGNNPPFIRISDANGRILLTDLPSSATVTISSTGIAPRYAGASIPVILSTTNSANFATLTLPPAAGFFCGGCNVPLSMTVNLQATIYDFQHQVTVAFATTLQYMGTNKGTFTSVNLSETINPFWCDGTYRGDWFGYNDTRQTWAFGHSIYAEIYVPVYCPPLGCPTKPLSQTTGSVVSRVDEIIAGCGSNGPYSTVPLGTSPTQSTVRSASIGHMMQSSGPEVEGRLVMRAHANSHTGYGIHAERMGRELERLGQPVAVEPVDRDPQFIAVSPWVDQRLIDPVESPKFVTKAASGLTDHDVNDNVLYTMWESSRLRPDWVQKLNRCRAILVPCRWNLKSFQVSGVTAPIEVIPLGIDPDLFRPTKPAPADRVVFGTAGRTAHGGVRKGLDEVIAAFLVEFGSEPTAWLEVKVWPDCVVYDPHHPRVTINRDPLSEADLAAWYGSLSVYVSASKGEGWGFHPLQAMACGRPVISAFVGGHAEYLTLDCAWPVEYDEVPTPVDNPIYGGLGNWFVPRPASLQRKMRAAFADPAGRYVKGERSAERAREFTWERTGRELFASLVRYGLIVVPPARPPVVIDPVQVRVDTCPFASGWCGCLGSLPRDCSRPGRPAKVMQRDPLAEIDCYRCQSESADLA